MGRAFGSRLLASAVLLLCLAAAADAQYFGRNKVQYDRDDVRVLATEHFDIYFASEDAAAAQLAGRLAERWHARLSRVFDHQLRGRQPLVLYGSHRRFEQTNVYGGLIDESTGGFTDSRKRRIVLPFASSLADTDHVLGHEIVHAFQFDIADQYRSGLTVPLWFIEGMAEYLTLGPDDPQTAMWMRDAVRSRRLPHLKDLSASRYFPYRWGAAVWSHLAARYGADLPAKALRARRDVKRRLLEATGRSLDELTKDWHWALAEKYGGEETSDESGRALIASRAGGGRLNLAASLSPDGRRMVFLSERDQLSIDLFLADAATGRVQRKLLTTAGNAEFESLQYLHSAGAWDPTGSRFALATIKGGRPSLLILDIDTRGSTRELPLPQVDEVYSPTWSPDGDRIAFSAMKGGQTDLFVVKLSDGALRRITNDPYADLQPAWSPDGRAIAFATDRFTTNLRALTIGGYRLALLDTSSLTITEVPGLGANHLDPSWAPDARSLYFVADPDGISNIFRLNLSDHRLHRMTDVDTGVSGVTRVSPVLSVAARTGILVFSVFRHSGYEVRTIGAEDALAGTPAGIAARSAVPPAADPALAAYGLPAQSIEPVPPLPSVPSRFAQKQYSPRLSLEGIGSPYLSGGGGPLGGYVSAGGSMLFGDLLGDHQLLTGIHVSSRFDESAFGAMYINRRSRWNWGITVDQTPDVRLRTHSAQLTPDRERALTRERDRLLWTNRHLGGMAAYPFSRARRVELTAGVRHIAFERERRREVVSLVSGKILEHETSALADEPSIGVVDAGVAFVGDHAIFGATGPILGTRYRVQATTTTGGLKYTSLLADYRRYAMPVRPFTVAFRIVHTGRFGGDAGDFRLRDAYLGSSSLVRGYGPAAVVRAECPAGSSDCPALNTLLANRLLAAKLELRVPLLSSLTTSSRIRYGMLPMDAFVFADAGAGWGGEQRFGAGGVDGLVVRSVGAGIRVNLMGLIFEAAAVRPLDLKGAGWTLGFNLRPGF